QRHVAVGGSLGRFTTTIAGHRPVNVSQCILGVEFDGPVAVAEGAAVVALKVVGFAALRMGGSVLRIKPNRRSEIFEGTVVAACLDEHYTAFAQLGGAARIPPLAVFGDERLDLADRQSVSDLLLRAGLAGNHADQSATIVQQRAAALT